MGAEIIDGKVFAASVRAKVAEHVTRLGRDHGLTPGLAVVLVGEDPASQVYVRNKGRQTLEVGMRSVEHRLDRRNLRRHASRADRRSQRRSGDPRHPRAAAAAGASRRGVGDQRDRARKGRRRLPHLECRTPRDGPEGDGPLHAARMPDAAARPARRSERARRRGAGPLEHRRQADGAAAAPRQLHGDDRPFAHARHRGGLPPRRHSRRRRRPPGDRHRRLGKTRAPR